MANIANLITKLSGIITSLDDIRDAISHGGGGSSTASGVTVTPVTPLTGTNLQATTNETAALLQDHADEISTLNSSYIRGLKWKAFSYTYVGQTVAGTGYEIPNAKQTVFDLTESDNIIGMAFKMIGGDNNLVNITPTLNNSDVFIFKPDAGNTRLIFNGIVFYL